INWEPVSYVGTLRWVEHSTDDDDYNIDISDGPNSALCTAANRNSTLMEFDSDETVDRFVDAGEPWWTYFRFDVDRGSTNPMGINGKRAFAIGLITLDGEHSLHSELHPTYVLAIRQNEGTRAETWGFFARNWGNQSWCGSGFEPLNRGIIRVLLP